jgi:hypothetical protein
MNMAISLYGERAEIILATILKGNMGGRVPLFIRPLVDSFGYSKRFMYYIVRRRIRVCRYILCTRKCVDKSLGMHPSTAA